MAESLLSSVLPNNSIKGSYPRNPVSSVYVTGNNNVSTLEDVMYNNDIELGFQNPAFGGSGNVFRFPRTYQFLGPIVCRFKITYGNVDNIKILEDYLAYKIIRTVRYTVGGTENLKIEGDSLVPIVLNQCDSEEKKRKVLEYAGTACMKAGANQLKDKSVYYTALIPLPWSSLRTKGPDGMKPLPLHMLSEPVELNIDLQDKIKLFNITGGVGGDLVAANNITLDEAKLTFSYARIGNVQELRNKMYRYPFTSMFSHKFNIPAGATNTSKVSVDLNGFRKGECREIIISAVRNTENNLHQYYSGSRLKNLKVLFNGQVIYRADVDNQEIWDLVYNQRPSVHGYRKLEQVAVDANNVQWRLPHRQLASTAVDDLADTEKAFVYGFASAKPYQEKFYYTIPLSECLEKAQRNLHGHILGADLTKQSIQIEFDTLLNDAGNAGEAGVLYCSYHYNALWQFDGESCLLVY